MPLIRRSVSGALIVLSGCYSVSTQLLPGQGDAGTAPNAVTLLILHDDQQPSPLVVIQRPGSLTISSPCDEPDQPDATLWIPASTEMSSMQFAMGKIFDDGDKAVDESSVCARSIASCAVVGACGGPESGLGRFIVSRGRPCSKASDGQASEFKLYEKDADDWDWKLVDGPAADSIRCSIALEFKRVN